MSRLLGILFVLLLIHRTSFADLVMSLITVERGNLFNRKLHSCLTESKTTTYFLSQ